MTILVCKICKRCRTGRPYFRNSQIMTECRQWCKEHKQRSSVPQRQKHRSNTKQISLFNRKEVASGSFDDD